MLLHYGSLTRGIMARKQERENRKGWYSQRARHSGAGKKAWKTRKYNQAKEEAMKNPNPPPKKSQKMVQKEAMEIAQKNRKMRMVSGTLTIEQVVEEDYD